MNSILVALECPICLDTIPPPAHQCGNGHLICVKCRVKTERCPVCRMRFSRGRSLLADQVFNSLTEAFELKDEAEETRPAKLRERLFGPKKNKQSQPFITMPELKISLVTTPTNKFLTRILGKSSSVDNLSSNPVNLSAIPRNLSEFSSNLRAKSLSTSEICHPPGSQSLSRSPSINSSHCIKVPHSPRSIRPASYHGSCESLDADLRDKEQLYCCPCEQDCPGLIKALQVMQHIQESHKGPLVHYFKPRLSLSFPLAFDDTAVIVISNYGNTFFFKVVRQPSGSVKCEPGDTLVWIWLLGSKQQADNYELILNLKGHGYRRNELNFRCKALSLSSHPWREICKTRGGICLTANSLIENFATELETGTPIKMEVEVKDMLD